MNRKIAIIGIRGYPAGFPGSGGIDFYFQAMLPELIKSKYKILLFVRSWAKNPLIRDEKHLSIINIPTINSKYLDTPIYSLIATLLVCFTDFEAVWYHAPGSALFCFLPKFFGKKIYLTLHGIDWKREKWGLAARLILRFAEFLSINLSDEIFVVSADLKKYLLKEYKKESQLASPKIYIYEKLEPIIISGKYGLKKNGYLLFLGRLVPEKRIEWIIKAFNASKNLKKDYKLVIAGEITKDKYSKKLLSEAKQNRSIVFTGFVKDQIKEELLSNCKIFLLPSSIEGFSIALTEAIGYGKTCLTSDVNLSQEFFNSSSQIYVFKMNSFSDFVEKLEDLANK